MEYNSDFSHDLKIGQDEEVWLGSLLQSKTGEGKRGFKCGITGNVFVEYESRGKPSGLGTSLADFWAFILDGQRVVIVPTEHLKRVAMVYYNQNKVVTGGDSNTSKGVLVPVKELL